MKRWIALLLCVLLCLWLTTMGAAAEVTDDLYEEQLAASGADTLLSSLPAETQSLLRTLGIYELSLESLSALQPQTVLSALLSLCGQQQAPFSAAILLLGVLLVLALFSSFQEGLRSEEGVGAIFRAVCAMAAAATLLVPLWQTVERVQAAAESAGVLSLSFAPIYAAVVAAQGYTLSAAAYQAGMLAATQGIALLSQSVILPLLTVSLSLGIAGAIHPGLRIGEAGAMLNKIAVWLLSLLLTLFVGLLSLQTLVSAPADSVGGRLLRFSVAGFVPVVGGTLSEALYTVRGCLSAVRGTVGAFGSLASLLIVLPTLLECILWSVSLFFCHMAAELFSIKMVASAVGIAQSVVKTMIGVLCANWLLMVVAVTLLTVTGGGGV